jgi:Reverse transcriptase (RNA-dependent DNA polymerase)
VVDIGGAFLNADMGKDVPVHMHLDKTMSEFLTSLDPSYRTFVDDRGGVTVKLKKALNGCVESTRLWYENLRATVMNLGYKRNELDVCVLNKTNKKGVQCTVCVHVDDLMIMCKSKSMINDLTEGLTKRYGEISLKHGSVINYLGMVLDYSHAGQVEVTMCTDELLKSSGIPGTARTPGTDGLFKVRDTALPVPEEVRVCTPSCSPLNFAVGGYTAMAHTNLNSLTTLASFLHHVKSILELGRSSVCNLNDPIEVY